MAVCDVKISVTGPGLQEVTQLTATSCTYFGGSKPGHYTISVERGNEVVAVRELEVSTDACGVVLEATEIKLSK